MKYDFDITDFTQLSSSMSSKSCLSSGIYGYRHKPFENSSDDESESNHFLTFKNGKKRQRNAKKMPIEAKRKPDVIELVQLDSEIDTVFKEPISKLDEMAVEDVDDSIVLKSLAEHSDSAGFVPENANQAIDYEKATQMLNRLKKTTQELCKIDRELNDRSLENASTTASAECLLSLPVIIPASQRTRKNHVPEISNDVISCPVVVTQENKMKLKTRLNGTHEHLWKFLPSDPFSKVQCKILFIVRYHFIIHSI